MTRIEKLEAERTRLTKLMHEHRERRAANKLTDKQLNERLAEHTCYGAIFLGTPIEIAHAECPACPTLCDWEHSARDFDGGLAHYACGAAATHRLLIEHDAIEPLLTIFACAEHRDAIIDDLRDCGDARLVDDALMGE